MRPKVELNQIRGFNDIVDDSILFFKQNFKPLLKSYVTICGIFWVASIVISVINEMRTVQLREIGESIFTTTYFINLLIGLLNMMVLSLTTLSYISVYQQKEKETPTVPEVWGYFKFYFFRFLWAYILLTLCLVAAFFCCIVPSIYFLPIFSLILAIMVIENTTFSYAFNRGFKLIKDKWGEMFSVMLVVYLLLIVAVVLLFIPCAIIVTVGSFLTGYNVTMQKIMFAFNISSHITAFLGVIVHIGVALVYYSLTEQKDDIALFERITKLGVHDASATQSDQEEEQY